VEDDFSDGDEDSESRPLVPRGASSSAPDDYLNPCEAAIAVRVRKQEVASVTNSDMITAACAVIIVILGGILRFHIHACKAEKDGDGHKGACKHPFVVTMFLGQLEFWMDDEATAWRLHHLVTSLPLWSCLLIALYYGHQVYRCGAWTMKSICAFQACAVATGLLAGLVGVGGGLIFAPFFLVMGMDPAVAVGTSSTCVLFTSSSTTMQYLFTDRIIMSLALVYGLVTLSASYVGTSLVHTLQDRFKGRRSYITMVVAVGVALSAVLSLGKFVQLVRGKE